ncbi:hypothetical protein PHYSODRAFT_262399 [Phytophthora sojae]|uniref:DDE Tnp4 domain-containing protein n=1 Tax=Phytophthora sojae (strain P6497) TaxID=1094619 RepID=G4ZHC6_PHYSP|nr:hypothetical protein PHYSODRAFT_262399 [Phytophthora sojae]EGZ17596.1 hypothetical protein PHYSODRAFT_262399 [Phytophthora sojae]|eukprot:XP_009526654.1 hypothetical protein PHYSODRAFT_262399 [Phytophthora sojae]
MHAEDADALLVLASTFLEQDEELHDARREVYRALALPDHPVPGYPAWMMVYKYGSDVNFLNTTSWTRSAFNQLLQRFSRFYYIPRHTTRGRPTKRKHHHQVLGLVLCFYVGSMEQSSLCMLFGVPPTRQAELAKLVEAREPLLKHTFGFIDGKNFRVQQPSNADLQNAMYNGWLHTVFVTGTICFAADGCIIWSKHNCPGSWNDLDTSLGFRAKLLDPAYCPDTRMNVVPDSAFPCSTAMVGRILTPLKDGDLERIRPSLRSSARTLHNAITSVRQAAEWGIGSIQKVYSHLNLPLPYDPNIRGCRISNVFRMANYRVRTVGISQIRPTFSGEMELPPSSE